MCEKDVRGNRERTSFYIYERDERERERERERREWVRLHAEKREKRMGAPTRVRVRMYVRAQYMTYCFRHNHGKSRNAVFIIKV